ncbi:MAG TPA: diacylglycerol kinase family protein [Flavisolibacter sp.]|nr:diacylglycerol kinase family protein [Flavisolibacter sp.]
MKFVHLFHNPGAGDEEHEKEDLVSLLRSHGYDCRYSSTKKKPCDAPDKNADFLVIAGGDGTVRKVAKQVLNRRTAEKSWPLALLPLGTANNIASTLGIGGDAHSIVDTWQRQKLQAFDIGWLEGIDDASFFIESFGYGLFPLLMKEMKKSGRNDKGSPEERLAAAQELLHQLILSYKARACKLEIDGTDHSGSFLMVEVMNTRSIGPNLFLSPQADPGDGRFEIVLIREEERRAFADHVLGMRMGKEETYPFFHLPADRARIRWQDSDVHADDRLVRAIRHKAVEVQLKQGLLQFFVP